MQATGTGQLRCTASRKQFVDRMGSPWQEFDARYRQDNLAQARARLGDEQLERAYAHGMALSLDQALDLALRRSGPA